MRYLADISIIFIGCGYEAVFIENISKICFSFISVNFKRCIIFLYFLVSNSTYLATAVRVRVTI